MSREALSRGAPSRESLSRETLSRGLTVRRILVSLTGVAILLAVGNGVRAGLASFAEEPEKSAQFDLRVAVRTMPAKRGVFRESLTGYGRARALRHATVAAEVAGLVLRVHPELEAGNAVEQGEELVWLDDRDLKDAVASIEARLARNAADADRIAADAGSLDQQLELAREELAIAKREQERVAKLLEREVATTSDQDAEALRVSLRRTAILRLEADRKRTDALRDSNAAEKRELEVSLRQARTNLARAVVRAPYAGRIEMRNVQPGSRVAPGSPLFELVDLSRVEIPVALPASRHGQVAVGTEAVVRLPGGSVEEWKAKVVRLAPTVRADDRTFLVYLESDGERVVPPGAFVMARILGRSYPDVFVVPRTAFVGKRLFVFENGVARERRPVIVQSLPAVILCSSGLEPGDRIIVTNLEQVADGAKVSDTHAGSDKPGDA